MSALKHDELKQDILLRREAGEGWRESGMDAHLLKLIVAREVAIDIIVEQRASIGSDEMKAYSYLAGIVLDHKTVNNISDPPPLSTEGN